MTVSSSPTQIPPPVTAAERRWLARFAWLAMLLTTLPYLVAFLNQGADWVFSGFVFTVEDGNSYIAKMLDGSFGAWLFRTPYTAHPQNGALVYLPYLILGKLASPPNLHLKLVLLYHVVRILAGVLVFFAAYDFLAVFLHKVTTRRWAVVLGTLGGGLGWLAVLAGQKDWLGSLPLDFYSPESFGFLSIFGLPHLALARAFLLWGLAKYLAPLPSQPKAAFMDRPAVHAGLLWFLLAFMQPLTVVIAWGVLSAHLAALAAAGIWRARRGLLVEWRTWQAFFRRAISAGLLSSPLVIYTTVYFSLDPFLKTWTAQNIITSPHPAHYLLAYGLMLPFVYKGARHLFAQVPSQAWLPIAWLAALPFWVYAPVAIQRRLAEGVWLAIVVMAAASFDVSAVPSPAKRPLAPRLLLFLSLPTTIFIFLGSLLAAANPGSPLFIPSAQAAAFHRLGELAPADAVVLSSFDTGNALPAWAPLRVVIGNGPESLGLAELSPRVTAFFQPATAPVDRLALLSEHQVSYVFWGPGERALGAWLPASAPYLTLVYQEDGYSVFEVVPSP